MKRLLVGFAAITALLMTAACVPNIPLRPVHGAGAACPFDLTLDPPKDGTGIQAKGNCALETSSLQEFNVIKDSRPIDSFLLSFVEFDDQGKPQDRGQQDQLLDSLKRESDKGRDLCIFVYVHGWRDNVEASDPQVAAFRQELAVLTALENVPKFGRHRKVIGVEVGWRGRTLFVPPYIGEFATFWARKDAAERVAHGSFMPLLGALKSFRDQINSNPRHGQLGITRMVTIGHSFGGLIVYSALAQYHADQAADAYVRAKYFPAAGTTSRAIGRQDSREIAAFGDLVLIVNPAIEAVRYEPIQQLLREQPQSEQRQSGRFAPGQRPVLIEVSSLGPSPLNGDWPNEVLFPAGRSVSSAIFEATHDGEWTETRAAMGHYRPYFTHLLTGGGEPKKKWEPNAQEECKALRAFDQTWRDPNTGLKEGWQRTYAQNAVVTQISPKIRAHLPSWLRGDKNDGEDDPNSPFWIMASDPSIIPGHSEIEQPIFTDFVRQLVDDLDRERNPNLFCGGQR